MKNRLNERQKTDIEKNVDSMKLMIPEMTLRDYFAGQVLAGMGEYLMLNRDNLDSIAKTCYRIADSFLENR